jgi:hypothetical protein
MPDTVGFSQADGVKMFSLFEKILGPELDGFPSPALAGGGSGSALLPKPCGCHLWGTSQPLIGCDT